MRPSNDNSRVGDEHARRVDEADPAHDEAVTVERGLGQLGEAGLGVAPEPEPCAFVDLGDGSDRRGGLAYRDREANVTIGAGLDDLSRPVPGVGPPG